jgi:hypothetical protein
MEVVEKTSKKVLVNWTAQSNVKPIPVIEGAGLHQPQVGETYPLGTGTGFATRVNFATNDLVFAGVFDTTSMQLNQQAAIRGVSLFALASIILSLLVALHIASKITKPVQEMLLATNGMSARDTVAEKILATQIKEFDDLAGTFETVQSVVLDTLRSTQRQLIENEQTRDLTVIHHHLSESLVAPESLVVELDDAKLLVSFCFPAGGSAGQFSGLEGKWFFCGSLNETDKLSLGFSAFSFVELLKARVGQTEDARALLESLAGLFSLNYCCLAEIKKNQISLTRFENGECIPEQVLFSQHGIAVVVTPKQMNDTVVNLSEVSAMRGVGGVIAEASVIFADVDHLCVMAAGPLEV